jgi:hypothetical protein
MIRHNKRDTAIHPSVNPKTSPHPRVTQAGSSNTFESRPDVPRSGSLTFAEDFIREHSLPGLQGTPIAIAGSF